MNILALTSLELWLAVIAIVLVSIVGHAGIVNAIRSTVRHEVGCVASKINQLQQWVNKLPVVDEGTLPTRRTQLEINMHITNMLSQVLDTDKEFYRDQAIAACKALDDYDLKMAQQQIHTHEAYH